MNTSPDSQPALTVDSALKEYDLTVREIEEPDMVVMPVKDARSIIFTLLHQLRERVEWAKEEASKYPMTSNYTKYHADGFNLGYDAAIDLSLTEIDKVLGKNV